MQRLNFRHTSHKGFTLLPSSSTRKGFTLLEILLVVAIIAILAGIVIVAINPARQLGLGRDSERKSDINTIYKAVNQYLIDKGTPPLSITSTLTPICVTGQTGDCVDLSALVPTYLPEMPKDPTATSTTGYEIAKVNGNVYVEASCTEIGFTNQAGYSTSTPVDAFVGQIPTGITPSGASGSCSVVRGSGGGGVTTHTVTFDANGGTGSMSAQTITQGASANLTSNSFTLTDHIFSGWSTTSGGSVAYADGASYTMGGSNVTLYAVWATPPAEVTVSGAGDDSYNGVYPNSGTSCGYPYGVNSNGKYLYFEACGGGAADNVWALGTTLGYEGNYGYVNTSNTSSDGPAGGNWITIFGSSPVPTVTGSF